MNEMMINNDNQAKALARLVENVARMTHRQGYSNSLNPAQWNALRYFGRASEEACTVMHFARHHGTTKGTASRTVAALVEKRFVRRRPSTTDRRKHFLELTQSGLDLLAQDPILPLETAFQSVDDEHRVATARTLEHVIRHLFEDKAEMHPAV